MIFVLIYTNRIDAKKFIGDVEPYFKMLMEDDYVFLLNVKYGGVDLDVNKLFNNRIRDAVLVFVAALAYFLFTNMSFINLLIAFILAVVVFKAPYTKLQNHYKANLSKINQMLPYYLKSLEILVQHYTVPVALARSI